MAYRAFKSVDGVMTYAPSGGLVDVGLRYPEYPADAPELTQIAQRHGIPVEQIRRAFGTLPASTDPAPAPVEEAVPEAPEVVEEKVEEEAPKPKAKKAKKKKEE